MSFRKAVTRTIPQPTRTTNGMVTLTTSGSPVLDFFSTSGAMRTWNEDTILKAFHKAMNHDPLNALRALFYARDARNGQGERRLFRVILKDLAERFPEVVYANLPLVAKYGRWDDLTVLEGTPAETSAGALWVSAIQSKNRLAAKWAPRKGAWFGILRKLADVDARGWRKTLVANTDVVESRMCRGMWDVIDYKAVPSRAAMIYRKAFGRHDNERYVKFITAAVKGDVKMNAKVLYPHEFVSKPIDPTMEALWKNLPDYVQNSRGFLPVCDVSSSMSGQPMDVSVGLGVYLAEKNKSVFKDLVVTFSESPIFVDLTLCKSLASKLSTVKSAPWGMNTNLQKTFELMLQLAVTENVAPEDMPETILIISDMQFDQCGGQAWGATAQTMIERLYAAHGYTMPSVVFWNVNAYAGQSPVKANKAGVALVSGFSPSIMTSILARKPEATPVELMMDKLKEYDDVQLP